MILYLSPILPTNSYVTLASANASFLFVSQISIITVCFRWMLWMTSASELFHSRRYHRSALLRGGLDNDEFSLPSSSSSSHQQRSTIRRHNRRDACSRPIHRRHLDLLEYQPVSPEEGDSHSPSGSGSSINLDGRRSIHSVGTGNDRLPGSVLLARERLVERLRGVSVSGNRQNIGGSSSSIHQNDFSTHSVSELRNNTRAEMVSGSWQETRRVGLNEDELKCLQLEAFSSERCRKNDESLSASIECTICLEGFQDGDQIICLLCTHRFHSCCLFPWVRVCGACPNCRKPILVNAPVK